MKKAILFRVGIVLVAMIALSWLPQSALAQRGGHGGGGGFHGGGGGGFHGGGGGGFMEAGIGKFLKPVGEGGTQDPRFVTFSVLANLRSRRMAPEHKEA